MATSAIRRRFPSRISRTRCEPAGELNIHLPPWDDQSGTRIWPQPLIRRATYIALMMDRLNYPGMPKHNWTHGAMYLCHAHLPEENHSPYEYQKK